MENAPGIVLEGEEMEPAALVNACAAGDAAEADRLARLLLRQSCTEASAIAFIRAYFQMLGVIQSIADAHPRAGRVEVDAYVGYGDVNNFIRKFKKKEGMTPLVYRKKMAVSAEIQAIEG